MKGRRKQGTTTKQKQTTTTTTKKTTSSVRVTLHNGKLDHILEWDSPSSLHLV